MEISVGTIEGHEATVILRLIAQAEIRNHQLLAIGSENSKAFRETCMRYDEQIAQLNGEKNAGLTYLQSRLNTINEDLEKRYIQHMVTINELAEAHQQITEYKEMVAKDGNEINRLNGFIDDEELTIKDLREANSKLYASYSAREQEISELRKEAKSWSSMTIEEFAQANRNIEKIEGIEGIDETA